MRADKREPLRMMAAALTGVGLFGRSEPARAEPLPETARIRLNKVRSICPAPQYVAEELLRGKGFTDIQYVGEGSAGIGGMPAAQALVAGAVDISMNFAAPLAVAVDAGAPITILGGVHPGCFELFGSERIRTITDLKGKTAESPGINSAQYLFLASISASVGLDAQRDINWVTHSPAEAMRLFADDKIDALLAFPPMRRNCARRRSVMWCSTAPRTGPGPSTTVAWRWPTATSPASIRSRPSAHCAQSSRAATSEPAIPIAVPRRTSISAFRPNRSTRARRCAKYRTAAGETSTPRTRCASTPSDCARRG